MEQQVTKERQTAQTPREQGATQAIAEAKPCAMPEKFQAAARAYHDGVSTIALDHQKRLNEIVLQRNRDVSDALTQGNVQDLSKINEGAEAAARAAAEDANTRVSEVYRRYIEGVRAAWASVSADELGCGTLVALASELNFISCAAAGAYPPGLWLPLPSPGGSP
jgi:hypothetical protein